MKKGILLLMFMFAAVFLVAQTDSTPFTAVTLDLPENGWGSC